MNERMQRMHTILESALSPEFIEIDDESHLHRGHAGAQDGRGHFALTLVSAAFDQKTAIARHRMVYQALGDMMSTDIHALKMNLYSSDEFDSE